MIATIVPVGSLESLYSAVGIILLIICFAILIAKKVVGWFIVLTIFCLGGAWVGLERGNGYTADDGTHPMKTTNGYEIMWRWEDGTFHDEPQWGYKYEGLYEKAKKERYYAMHVRGDVSPRFYHPDSLYIAPLIVLLAGLLVCPSLWPVLYFLIVKLFEPEKK